MPRLWPALLLVALASVAAHVALLRRGIASSPALLTAHATAVLAVLAGWAVREAWSLARERRLAGAGRLLLASGLALALGGAVANGLMSIQGYVLLVEGDEVALAGGARLDDVNLGPLAPASDLDVRIRLVEVDFVAAEDGGFRPFAELAVSRAGEPARARIGLHRSATSGAVRFLLGAFGFAPRVVVLKDGASVYDATVPFLTAVEQDRGVSFGGEVRVEREDLVIRGEVGLEGLDERMRGHPTLALEVDRGSERLGQGVLRLGHFAEVPGGYRVGFAGMKSWAEIDVARRSYARTVFAGLGVAALGVVLCAGAAARRLRARRTDG